MSLALKFFTDAAAQDQVRAAALRQQDLFDWSIQAFLDESGASLDALAMGFKPTGPKRSYGGIKPRVVG